MATKNDYPQRTSERGKLLARVQDTARVHGASAMHVLGSIAQSSADEHSDIDVWLTFPDNAMTSVVQNRRQMFAAVGDVLIAHEARSNRPVGGAYSLVVYITSAGPMQVDWYLAPQTTSRVAPDALKVFEDDPVQIGEWRLDSSARSEQTLTDRVDWLVCMLFVGAKKVLRGRDREFEAFLARAYRDIGRQYDLADLSVGTPDSLRAIEDMLLSLNKYADTSQRRAISVIHAYLDFFRSEIEVSTDRSR